MAKKDINNDNKNNFGKELKAEMKKVTWPSMKKLVNNTSAVISITLVVALIVFVIDLCFENLNKFGIERIKTAVSSETEETESDTEEVSNDVDLTDATVTDGNTEGEATTEENADTTAETPADVTTPDTSSESTETTDSATETSN